MKLRSTCCESKIQRCTLIPSQLHTVFLLELFIYHHPLNPLLTPRGRKKEIYISRNSRWALHRAWRGVGGILLNGQVPRVDEDLTKRCPAHLCMTWTKSIREMKFSRFVLHSMLTRFVLHSRKRKTPHADDLTSISWIWGVFRFLRKCKLHFWGPPNFKAF